MKIAIIGAGPAGLYFSTCQKHDPSHEITIYEQNPQGATYGWGVVFSDIGLAFLREADPEFFGRFVAHHERCDYMEIVHQGTRVRCRATISRARPASTCWPCWSRPAARPACGSATSSA